MTELTAPAAGRARRRSRARSQESDRSRRSVSSKSPVYGSVSDGIRSPAPPSRTEPIRPLAQNKARPSLGQKTPSDNRGQSPIISASAELSGAGRGPVISRSIGVNYCERGGTDRITESSGTEQCDALRDHHVTSRPAVSRHAA